MILGISAEAVRGRIRRGTIPVEREDGTVYVLLEGLEDRRTTADQSRTTADQPGDRTRSDSGALISEMRDRIASLERQLEQERQANSEHRRLLAAALERIPPQLEAPTDSAPNAPGSPERVEEQQGRGDVQSEGQTATSRRPWWRRVFGSE